MQCHRHPPQPQRPPLLGWPLLPQPPPLLLPCCAAQRCSTAAAWPPHQRPCAAWAHTQENKHSMETRVQLVKQPVDGQQHGRFCKSTTCELLHVKRLQARLLAQDPRQYQCLFRFTNWRKPPKPAGTGPAHRASAAPHQHVRQVCQRVAAHRPHRAEAEAGVVGDQALVPGVIIWG